MNIRELVRQAVDADVETGAETAVIVMDFNGGKVYSVKEVTVDPTSYDDGGNPTSTGATVFIMVEEM